MSKPEQITTLDASGFIFCLAKAPAGHEMSLHAHGDPHFAYVVSGTIEDVRRDSKSQRNRGDLVFLPANEEHATKGSGPSVNFVISVKGDGGVPKSPMEFLSGPQNRIAARMAREFGRTDEFTSLMLQGLAYELLATIGREAKTETDAPWLRQTREYLNEHFRENIGIDQLAKRAAVHPAHLMRSFHHRHQCSIGEYVRNLRIEQACSDLSLAKARASNIAANLGFADQSHFTRVFKRAMGMTPAEFQRNAYRVP